MRPTIRTTIGELLKEEFFIPGIYVIACYPSLGCLYVGMSNDIHNRIMQHLTSNEPLAGYIKEFYVCSYSWRVDIFHIDDIEKRIDVERRLIKYFHPVFNEQGLSN